VFEKAPNGYFMRDLIIFNGLSQGGYASKGFIFQPPDLANAQISELNEFQNQLCLLLASLNDNQRLQVQFYCDSDYRNELLSYQRETEKAARNAHDDFRRPGSADHSDDRRRPLPALQDVLNPSLAERFDYDPIDAFDPELSIQENCWHCEGQRPGRLRFFHGRPLPLHHRPDALAEDDLSRSHPPADQPAAAWTTPSPSMSTRCPSRGEIQGGKGARPHRRATTPAKRNCRC
jgi:hypothetical protein